ncbi:uncharacterized protein LOC127002753 isoform X2 [Eriocheir sinensis]|uniref:uncharacterized protein LOC127002753 isoform X2 n=1 Tax=Eriocheir sinensis TaxID=95602 RepID=UPI0021CAABF1|nr:uncharacterized protein LOC127002753 isoform X2 [Eriocheir sinensis]
MGKVFVSYVRQTRSGAPPTKNGQSDVSFHRGCKGVASEAVCRERSVIDRPTNRGGDFCVVLRVVCVLCKDWTRLSGGRGVLDEAPCHHKRRRGKATSGRFVVVHLPFVLSLLHCYQSASQFEPRLGWQEHSVCVDASSLVLSWLHCHHSASQFEPLSGWQEHSRREGVRLDQTSQNGLMVRVLGDVKGNTTVETSLAATVAPSRSTDAQLDVAKTDARARATLTMNYNLGDMNVGEAEERLLGGAGRGSYSRFLTLHRRRRRKLPTRRLDKEHQALLDDLYNGLTQYLLSRVGVWGFNAFTLDSVCGGRPVSVLCVFLLHEYGLIEHFKFDTVTVWKCFSLIEDGYHASNPYHNAIHAADVTQAMHCYLQEEKIHKHLTPLEMLAALIAAVCHDLDHPGVNQPFLIATDNHLAALYKNFSVLENHHWRCAMGCLWESGLLDSWDSEDVASLQDMLRSLILATDITRQQEFLTRFKQYLDSGTFDMQDPEHRHFSLQIALKCADICNPCRPWEVSQKWSYQICEEFYRQGDYERQLNLPVTLLCDSSKMSVAKIQTDFIKYVVSPLFDVWNRWLETSLSNSMVTNMKTNQQKWEERLLKKKLAEDTAPQPLMLKDSADNTVVESAEEEPEEVDGGTSPSSSGDSHQSVLGSLENVSRSLQLGRRHSVPLNMPRLLPRTIIRRESLPEHGNQPLVVETVTMGGMSLTSLTSGPADNSALTPEALLPEPSITTMGGVGIRLPRPTTRLTRRKSLPPLWLQQTRARTSHMLQPLSPTPSEDGSSHATTQENSPQDPESAQRLGAVHGAGSGQPCGNTNSGCGGSGGCDRVKSGGGECSDPAEQLVHHPIRGDAEPLTTAPDVGVHSRKCVSNHQGATTFLHADSLDARPYRPFIGRGLVRRASLDSTSISSKREFLDRLLHESSKFPRVDRTNSELDKENIVPREAPKFREHQQQQQQQQQASWKARAWRSLNCDDENVCDAREKMMKPGMYKLNQSQGSLYAHGRRGSAPLLRPEELLGGLRGGAERPDYNYLSLRRGSAPSHPNQKGCDVEAESEVGGHHTPLTSTENLPFSEYISSHSRLRGRRRGSIPFDHPGLCRQGSGGVEVLPSRTSTGGNFGVSGGGCGAAGYPSVLPHYYHEYHRGSGGLELFAGLWRSHLEPESSSSVFADGDLYSQSSGGLTPSTPGAVLPPHRPLPPHTLHRRGSLPTDLFYSGDFSVWDCEGT